DNEIGKTYATGFLEKLWTEQGEKVITQKLIQTCNADISEDIEKHREIMGQGWFQEDQDKLTMPENFRYPASHHLAKRLDNLEI
ncbi:dethiobiotin synthase, partial [Acinetobacter oleivorans]|uniref:dethiobiotin synthase n=1 Tax=Acinetobacter oleivorans TaxID=1148157 RepID=UPI003AF96DBE